MHSNAIQEEEADGRFRKLDHVFARAAQKSILVIFKEICKTFDFRLPVFQQQQPLSNTKKTVRMSLTIYKMGVPGKHLYFKFLPQPSSLLYLFYIQS